MKFAYAYDTSMRLMNELGQRSFPSAALIDPNGVVTWTGHPAALQTADIEKALLGALPIPMWEWPKQASGVRKALQKGDYAKALEKAQELEDGQTYVDTVKAVIQGRLDGLVKAYEAGDFLRAYEAAGELRKAFKGLPEADRAAEIHAAIKGDKDAQAVIKAQKTVAKLAAEVPELRKRKDAEKLMDELREVQQKSPGTYAARQAGDLADEIRKLLPNLR